MSAYSCPGIIAETSDTFKLSEADISLDNILSTVQYVYGECFGQFCTSDEIKSKSRKREFVDHRKLICRLANDEDIFGRLIVIRRRPSLALIGEYLNTDHATVLHHIRDYNNMMDTNKTYRLAFTIAKMRILKSATL